MSQRQQHTSHPTIIQGGMGIAVSGWELAAAVTATGQLGVVSGTGLEAVYARKLQAGDPGGHLRRAFEHFPIPEIVEAVLDRYYVAGGIPPGQRFKSVPVYTLDPPPQLEALSVLTNFAEVWLAKERAGGGRVGVNYLYKIQMPILASLYGAMLAGVDYVIIGAGNPSEVPAAMTHLAAGSDARLSVRVQYADPKDDFSVNFSPARVMGDRLSAIPRPQFLAIVSSTDQAEALCRNPSGAPDGFVFEAATAGGHNAPPRGPLKLSDEGEPRYGPLDDLDVPALKRLERPFWLAGAYGRTGGLKRALEWGAEGIQVGTAFAFCSESGLADDLKASILDEVIRDRARVFTDARASPTGFPFKVVQMPGTLAAKETYDARPRACDLGFLRVPFMSPGGALGYRCPAEPERLYMAKRGREPQVGGRKRLCNALLANVGLAQIRRDGQLEEPLVTAGDDLANVREFLPNGEKAYRAVDVIERLLADQPHQTVA